MSICLINCFLKNQLFQKNEPRGPPINYNCKITYNGVLFKNIYQQINILSIINILPIGRIKK